MKSLSVPLLIAVLVGATGCTNMSKEQQGTVTGAGIGAAAGAGFAALTGGHGWTGAAIGAAAGAVAGNMKGRSESQ